MNINCGNSLGGLMLQWFTYTLLTKRAIQIFAKNGWLL